MAEIDRRSLFGGFGLIVLAACRRRGQRLRIAAAASTASVLEALLTGRPIDVDFAASSTLARQIEAGAPFDLFLSADPTWIDRLEAAGRLKAGSRRLLFANRLVLAVPAGTPHPSVEAAPPGRVAVGDPSHVPLGRYAKSALEGLGWWSSVEERILTGVDARATARLLELGEADWGLVYRTDAIDSPRLEIVWELPEEQHEPIRYELAVLEGAAPTADGLADELSSNEAKASYQAKGFVIS